MEKINVKLTKLIYYIIHIFFRLVNAVNNHKTYLIIVLFMVAYTLGLDGIHDQIELSKVKEKLGVSWFSSIWILAFENLFVNLPGDLTNLKVVAAQFISHLALFLTVLFALFKKWVTQIRRYSLAHVEHTLVIGLGENNRQYLESELNSPSQGSFIIIEPDVTNIHAKYFMEKGIGVYFGTLDKYKVQFKHLRRAVISTGNDRSNIEIVSKLMGMIPPEMTKKSFGCPTVIHVHLQNQDYKALFQQKIVNSRDDLPLEFKPYSFNDEAARALFEKHTILGNYYALAKTDDSYCVVVVGNGDLAERIIYHMCMLANLPNKNILTIHCVCEDAPEFLARIRSGFTGIDSISAVEFEAHSLHMDTPEFYSSDVWEQPNLTNVFVCHEDENINLECIVNLHDKVYLEKSVKKTMETKVHFAMYHNLELSRTINDNREEFKEFYTFGDANEICDRKHFIDETHENIAKLIHKGYGDVYSPSKIVDLSDHRDRQEIEDKWYDTTKFSDRESNRSQALHINTKLMSMGLKKVKVYDQDELDEVKSRELLKKNVVILKRFCEKLEISEEDLIKLSKQLPKAYDGCKLDEELIKNEYEMLMEGKSMIAKLMKAEHERWNAYHYLNGWSYSNDENIHKDKKKAMKKHDCLTSIDDFDDVNRQMTIIYDLYSIVYLPSYLASTGYKIKEIDYEEKPVQKNLDVKVIKWLKVLMSVKINKWLKALISAGIKDTVLIGITGHRNINMDDTELKKILKHEMAKVFRKYKEVSLLSPLAEGADRLFIQEAININTDKIKSLQIIMPLDKDEYMEDFKKESSKKVFEDLYALDKTYENIEVSKCVIDPEKEKLDRNGCYLNTGKLIVNKSDILFAIWNGEKANGKGGTAEIVDYAISKKKKIIWINPKTKKVYHLEYPYPCEIVPKSVNK